MQRPPAYAPTPYSYTPHSSLNATINLDEEVRLSTTTAERDLYESLAEVYSIIVTLDALERAFLRDSIAEADYTETCSRLLKQYKSNLTDENVARAFGDLERFKAEWQLECPRATERLKIGLPATGVDQPSNVSTQQQRTNADSLKLLATSENFITLLDAIRLGYKSKDSLHPLLADTIQAVNKVTDKDFQGKEKIVQWLITLNQMKPAQELDEEQTRELGFDMDSAYHAFKEALT
ncbi:MAG: hypothetical protein Q9162_002399 [Coniocarpon cinnabarinum]